MMQYGYRPARESRFESVKWRAKFRLLADGLKVSCCNDIYASMQHSYKNVSL